MLLAHWGTFLALEHQPFIDYVLCHRIINYLYFVSIPLRTEYT